MSRTQRRLQLGAGLLSACLIALVLILTAPPFVVTVNAADCHPLICHDLDPSSSLNDIILYWWFECDLPHCPECTPPI